MITSRYYVLDSVNDNLLKQPEIIKQFIEANNYS